MSLTIKMQISLSSSFDSGKPVVPPFSDRLRGAGFQPIASRGIRVLQVNTGYRCNMTCAHCHIGAGPEKTEIMERGTVQAVLGALDTGSIETLDITGGAPELNPHFRFLVNEAR